MLHKSLKLYYFIFAIILFAPLTNFANNHLSNGVYVGAGAGYSWQNLASNTTVNNGLPAPLNQDIYTINDPSNKTIVMTVGYRALRNSQFLPIYAFYLQYMHFKKSNIKGTVDQWSLPAAVNYNYNLGLESSIFILGGKLNLIEYKNFMPYVSAGVGGIFNHFQNYTETALPGVDPVRTSPGYLNTTKSAFAGTIGAGVDYILCPQSWLTLGYEHLFQKNLVSGQGAGSWSTEHLNFGRAQKDNVFLTLNYQFLNGE